MNKFNFKCLAFIFFFLNGVVLINSEVKAATIAYTFSYGESEYTPNFFNWFSILDDDYKSLTSNGTEFLDAHETYIINTIYIDDINDSGFSEIHYYDDSPNLKVAFLNGELLGLDGGYANISFFPGTTDISQAYAIYDVPIKVQYELSPPGAALPIPEPLTIFGSLTALGLGSLMKYKKSNS